MPLLLLAACLQRPTVDPGTGTTSTGATTATSSGATTGSTTGTTPPGPLATGVLVPPEGVDLPAAAVAAMRFHLDTKGKDEAVPVLEDPLAWAAAADDGTFAIPLPEEVPEEDFVELDPDAHPGLEGATYLALAHPDEDGDGAWLEGDPAWGTSLARAWVLVRGGAAYGVDDGWHVLLSEDGAFDFAPLEEPVEVVLRGLEAPAHLEGTAVQPEPLGVPEGVVGLPVDGAVVGWEPGMEAWDVPLAKGAWRQDLVDPPRSDLQVVDPLTGLVYASVVQLVYDDLDGSGGYSDTVELDPGAATVCWDGRPVSVYWFGTPTSYLALVGLELAGWHAGWLPLSVDADGNPVVLDASMAASLQVDRAACTL